MFTNNEKVVLLSALALDIETTQATLQRNPSLIDVAEKRLATLRSITEKVIANVQPTFNTRDGRLVEFVRDDPQNPDYDRRKVWRFVNGQEYRTDIDGKVGVDFAPYEHPADVMMEAR